MWFPSFTTRRRKRRRCRKDARPTLYDPVRLGIRRLEERRVLDVSAAFLAATGELQIDLTGVDTATVAAENGDITVTDQHDNAVPIDLGQATSGAVRLSDVEAVRVGGDGAPDQTIVFDTFLIPSNGLTISEDIETATLNDSVTSVVTNGIHIAAQTVNLAGQLEASSLDIVLGGNVVIHGDTQLTASNVALRGTVNDDGAVDTTSNLLIEANGRTRFDRAVGASRSLDSLETDSAGYTELGGDIYVGSGQVRLNDPVVLTSDVFIASNGSSGIHFDDTIDSQSGGRFGLTLDAAAGDIDFNGAIGSGSLGEQRLGHLAVVEASGGVIFGGRHGSAAVFTAGNIDIGVQAGGIADAGVTFAAGAAGTFQIDTAGGNLRVNGNVVLRSDLSIITEGGTVTFTADAPIDSQQNTTRQLEIDAGAGAVFFNEDLGTQVRLGGLVITRADAGVTFGGADAEQAGTGGAGPVEAILTSGPISVGLTAPVRGSGVTFNAGVGSVLRVSTTGDEVRIHGKTTLASALSVETGAGPGDILFTASTPIDSQVGEHNHLSLDAGQGAVRFGADLGEEVGLGRLTVVRANGGVLFGEPQFLGSDFGPLQRIVARAGVDVGQQTFIGGPGIVFNSASAGISVATLGHDIRFNGTVTLHTGLSIETGQGAGDVVLTNDSPIDSAPGLSSSLTIHAGEGSVKFNEDIGKQGRLGALTIDAGGVYFGERSTEVPGTGGQGPVQEVWAGPIDIGAQKSIGERGIVFTGGVVNAISLVTADEHVRINGEVQLASDLTVRTGDGPGDILFTASSPVNSADGATNSLQLDAGAGSISFNQDLGANQPLGRLSVIRARGGVQFGAVDQLSGDTETGAVTLVRVARGVDLGVDDPIGGEGISLAGGDAGLLFETKEGDARFNGPVVLYSAVMIDTDDGFGDVLFTASSPIDAVSDSHDLHLDAGDGTVYFNANLGERQRIGGLQIDRAAGGVYFGASNQLPFNGAGFVDKVVTRGSIDIGTGDGADDLIVEGIVLNAGDRTLTIEIADGDLRLNGPVRLESDLEVRTLIAGDLQLTSNARLDSASGETHDLRLDLPNGSAELLGPVGVGGSVGNFHVVAVDDLLAEQITAERIIQDAGMGTTAFNGEVITTSPEGLTLDGHNFEIAAPIAAGGDVVIEHSGALVITAAGDLRIDGSFSERGLGVVATAGSIATNGNPIHFANPVTITGGIENRIHFETTASATPGAAITFDSQVNGAAAGASLLVLDAGSEGDIKFKSAVGRQTPLGEVIVVSARDVVTEAELVVSRLLQTAGTGTTDLQGSVMASSATAPAIALNTHDVIIEDRVATAGNGDVTITVSGTLDLMAAAELQLSGGFFQSGGGLVQLAADIYTESGDIEFADPVLLGSDVLLDTSPGEGDIRFSGLLEGTSDFQQDLRLNAGAGALVFHSTVGAQRALGRVVIVDAGPVSFYKSVRVRSLTQDFGSGHTEFNGALTTVSDTPLAIRSQRISVNAPLDVSAGNAPVSLIADAISVDDMVSSGAAPIRLVADGEVALGDRALLLTEGTLIEVQAAGAVEMADLARIHTDTAPIRIVAGENIQLGQLSTSSQVQLRSLDGAILDGGDSLGADVVAGELAIESAAGTGTFDAIDTQVRRLAATNRAGGGLRIDNRIGDVLTVGVVEELRGIAAGSAESPLDLDGDLEITNRGPIHINQAIRNHSGGDTVLRAEFPGDLILNAPVQNRGGDGWIILFAGGDLVVNDSLPTTADDGMPFPQAEVSVENGGAIRGIARDNVIVENEGDAIVVFRTHAERFPDQDPPPEIVIPDVNEDPAGFQEALRAIRAAVAPQYVNVPPVIQITAVDQGGSEIAALGRAQLRVVIGSEAPALRLERNFQLTIDWGDGTLEHYPIPGNPALSGEVTAGVSGLLQPHAAMTGRLDSGVQPAAGEVESITYFVHHRYESHPDPDDPSAPIIVRAELRYDPRREGELDFDNTRPLVESESLNGVRFFENLSEELFGFDSAEFRAPGLGLDIFLKVVESKIIPVELRAERVPFIPTAAMSASVEVGEFADFSLGQFEPEAAVEYRLFLRIVDAVTGEEQSQEIELPIQLLDNPISLFTEKRFPNGHYRIYLEETQTRRIRLILDVHIYEGRVVPPNFRDGASERQPGLDDEAAVPRGDNAADLDLVDDERHRSLHGVAAEMHASDLGPDEDPQSLVAGATRKVGSEPAPVEGGVRVPSGDNEAALPILTTALLSMDDRWRQRTRQAFASGQRRIRRADRIRRRLRDAVLANLTTSTEEEP